MGFNEEELKKRIQESAEKIEVPESLKPENIESMLESHSNKKKKFRWKPVYTVTAAACCVLIVGGAVFGSGIYKLKDGNVQTESTEQTGGGEESYVEADVKTASAIDSAGDYDEIYQYIQEEQRRREQQNTQVYGESKEGAAESADMAVPESSAKTMSAEDAGGAGGEYSDTNIREAGVQEGDIIKTDGENLYILNGQRIQIVRLDGKKMEAGGTIRLEDDQTPSELFVKDKKLILAYTQSEYLDDGTGYGGTYKQLTVAETYDVSNPDKPKSIGKITQSGSYYTMRISGEHVYLISSFYADTSASKSSSDAYIPAVQGKLLDSKSILMPQIPRGNLYTVVSSFSLDDPEKRIDSKAIFGSSGQIYVSKNNIYVCESDYAPEDSEVTQTCIRKVAYKDGKLKAVGQTRINGVLNDSFSLDEYKGNLRLVTTVSGTTGNQPIMPLLRALDDSSAEQDPQKDSNSLYILDKELNELSKIEGLAKDEQVYSARFMGDVGYFVTYKQVDPLFSVDLSDPKNPEVIGELKIPGFSEYLHPYGEGLLLGVGMDVDETGVTTNGVKLSMFDISNPEDVEEVQKYVLEDSYSAELFYNYKCALIDVEKNLIGFSSYGMNQHYYIFSYDEDGFECVFDRELTGYASARGIYVDKILYLVSGNTVEAYQMESFEKLDDIVL